MSFFYFFRNIIEFHYKRMFYPVNKKLRKKQGAKRRNQFVQVIFNKELKFIIIFIKCSYVLNFKMANLYLYIIKSWFSMS